MNRILKNKKIFREINLRISSVRRIFSAQSQEKKNENFLKSKKTKKFLTALFLMSIVLSFVLAVNYAAAQPVGSITGPLAALESAGEGWPSIIHPLGMALWGVEKVLGVFLAIATSIFEFIIDPKNLSEPGTGILTKPAIMNVWVMVRDVLNMTFILVLLFSAFCTIFQIEKWNLKAVWKNILIFALLVNFSYSIARFIIDISNVAFYYFVNNLFGETNTTGTAIMSKIASVTQISTILFGGENFAKAPLALELTIIIFTFILAITFLVIAILFVVRMVMLAILIMFSPIGFVGYIFPDTAQYATKWWKQLLNYSFFAPIMIFMMSIALKVSEAIGTGNASSFKAVASLNTLRVPGTSAPEPNFIASAAFFSIPIIILWAGMGIAKSMGIAGADLVVGKAQGVAKWAGKQFSGYNSAKKWAKKNYDMYKDKRKERQKEIDKKSLGNRLGNKVNDLADATRAKFGDKEAAKRLNDRKTSKNKEDIKNESDKQEGVGTNTLVNNINANITTPPKDKDSLIKAAGEIKQAMSRGKEFELEIENRIKSGDLDKFIRNEIAAGRLKAGTSKKNINEVKSAYYARSREIISAAEKA